MKRTVNISEEAYQRLSHHCEQNGKSRLDVLSNLILQSFPPVIEEKTPIVEKKYPKTPGKSPYARWMRGETEMRK